MANPKDLSGQRFGKLVATKCTGKKAKCKNLVWECKCDCGNEIEVPTNRLREAGTQSCGCIRRYASLQDAVNKNTDWNGECLEWTGTINKYGYGQLKYKGKQITAHRAAYKLYNGETPKSFVIRHLCHNRRCVRKEHLAIGTYKDNSQDSVKAGRNNRGVDVNTAKLSESDVLEIREMCKNRILTQKKIAEKYGVHTTTIENIKSRKIWKHI